VVPLRIAQSRDSLWCAQWDEVDWQALIDLHFEHPIHHEVSNFIWIIDVDPSYKMHDGGVLGRRSHLKRRIGVGASHEVSQFVQRAGYARVCGLKLSMIHRGAPLCSWTASTNSRARLRVRSS
jgi:hypothetical protein